MKILKLVNYIIDLILEFYNNNIEFRLANSIYNDVNIDILIFLLGRKLIIVPELSWYIEINSNILENIINKDNKRIIKNMLKDPDFQCNVTVEEKDYFD